VRWTKNEKLVVVVNFSWKKESQFNMTIPQDVIETWKLKDGSYSLKDQLYGSENKLEVKDGVGLIKMSIKPSESFIFKLY